MMTARKRIGPLPTHCLAVRHSVDYSSSDHFSSNDSSRDSSSSSSSDTSSDSSVDALSDSASSRSSSDHSLPIPSSGIRSSHHLCSLVPSIHHSSAAIFERPSHSSSSVSPSCKRSSPPAASVPLSSLIPGALIVLSYRPREAGLGVNFEDESSEPSRYRETNLEMDVDVARSDGIDIDPEIQAEIDECIAYADALRDKGIDARVVVEAIDREEIETKGDIEVMYETLGDLVQRFHDHTEEIPVYLVQVIESPKGSRTHDRSDRTTECLYVGDDQIMPNTRFGASMTRGGDEQEEISGNGVNRNGGNGNEVNENEGNENGGNRNGENGNGNGNEGGNGYNFGGFVPARECTYQDFLKCHPLSFNGMEGVIGLNCWFEKMETMFHISNCPEKYQVKYATCTLLNSALTWWNSHKRTIKIEAAYAMSWAELMKLMTEVYYPINEVQKMETELGNLAMKGNDLTAYTRRFQELVLLCIRMVSNEEDKVERFVGGLPDNIQGNVIVVEPTKLQDAIRIANNLMDQKLKGKECPKLRNQNRGNKNGNKTGNQTRSNKATAKAYAIGGGGANPDSNVVTGTFLLNNCYASMFFDSGADKSFVSSTFSALLDVAPLTLDTSYAIELADGRISETNVVLRGYTLGLLGHPFNIDLLPVELGSFDIIISMDWLAKYHTLTVYDEKVVRIPYRDEVLIIRGDDCDGR
ncbi:putative reverse transcriptase domain-containing protein, partial [Tanacetum coccineum]